MKEDDVAKAAGMAVQAQYPNPRELEEDELREVIRRCWAGEAAPGGSVVPHVDTIMNGVCCRHVPIFFLPEA